MAAASASSSGTISLYHFTGSEGCQGILADKKIYDWKTLGEKAKERSKKNDTKPPRKRRPSGGEGIYLTDKCPALFSSQEIANRIWFDNTAEQLLKEGRTNFVFALEMKKDTVERADEGKPIWKFKRDKKCLDLEDMSAVLSWRVYAVKPDVIADYHSDRKVIPRFVGEDDNDGVIATKALKSPGKQSAKKTKRGKEKK